MNKLFRLGLILALVGVVALGTLPTIKAQGPTVVEIFVGIGAGTQPELKAPQQAIADMWNAANEDIKIEFTIADSNQAAQDALNTRIGSNPPDIVGPIGIKGIYKTPELYADLTPLIEADAAELLTDEYDPALLKVFQDAGGKTLSLALGVYPSVLFVNEDIFAAAEVPLPPTEWGAKYTDRDGVEHTWDWNTLAMVAKQITSDTSGRYADEDGFDPASIQNFGFGNDWVEFRNFVSAWGPVDGGVDADGKPTFTQDAYVNALTWLHNGIFTDRFIADAAERGVITGGGTSPFESGRLGMWYSQSWYTCCVGKATFKWNLYAGPAVPGADRIVSPLHADTFVIVANSTKQEAAWEVLKWLNSAEVASKLCEIYGCMPARTVARDAYFAAQTARFPGLNTDVISAGTAYADSPNNEVAVPNYAEADKAFASFFGSIPSTPDFDVKAALEAFNKTMEAVYAGGAAPSGN